MQSNNCAGTVVWDACSYITLWNMAAAAEPRWLRWWPTRGFPPFWCNLSRHRRRALLKCTSNQSTFRYLGRRKGESRWLAKFVCACFCSRKSALTPGWSLSNLQQERDRLHNIITAQRLTWHSFGSIVAFKLDAHSSFEAQRFRTIAI